MIRAARMADVGAPAVRVAPDLLEPYLEDASGNSPGTAAGVVRAASEAEAAAFLRSTVGAGVRVLPQGARTSVTGGAIPRGEIVLSLENLREFGRVERRAEGGRGTFGPGLRLRELQSHLETSGLYFPPVPTYQEAMLGGAVSTNAGGAATFKYGVTREWVHGLRVLLFNGDLLELERGQALARPGESFRIELSDGTRLDVPTPVHSLPDLRKISAGYYSYDPLDLVDLFVGSEGTLGVITSVTIDLVPRPPAVVTGLVFLDEPPAALELGAALRRAARAARERGDRHGPDVRAVEWLDEPSLAILRRHDEAKRRRIEMPAGARAALLFEVELEEVTDDERAQDLLCALLDGEEVPDVGLVRLFRLLAEHGALDHLEFAFPEDARRHQALTELREAVPQRVNEMLAERSRGGARVGKVGGDLIVPFDQLPEMIDFYRDGFARRGLEYAIWGHLADGNLHPNAIARNPGEVERGYEALLEFADESVRRGGCPLSEHGVGRNPTKQRMLRSFLGEAAVERMRSIKRALDPQGRFAPGVLFPAAP